MIVRPTCAVYLLCVQVNTISNISIQARTPAQAFTLLRVITELGVRLLGVTSSYVYY